VSDTSPWADLSRPPLRQGPLRRAVVDGAGPWTSLEVLPRIGSTNAELARRAGAGRARHGAVLATDHQVAGRGRRDRTWATPARAAVAVSVLLVPGPVPQQRWTWLPLLGGVGVREALMRVAGVPAELKWPNDVLVPRDLPAAPGAARGKVCGLLAEVVTTVEGPGVVLGLGINVSQRSDELPVPDAVSLAGLGAATTDRDTVLRAVLRAVGSRYEAWVAAAGDPRASGLGAAYREACVTIGRPVRVVRPGGEDLLGTAEGVDDDGRLLVTSADGSTRTALSAGDVVHVRPGDGPAQDPADPTDPADPADPAGPADPAALADPGGS
jgi:BirA family biotin operon repressor/biotin-[acetyl-CoA-carboxylase] ligase